MSHKAAFIERCSSLDQPGWLDMRVALWPDATADEHRGYMAISLAQPERFLQLMMYDEQPSAHRVHRRLDPQRLCERHGDFARGLRRGRLRGAGDGGARAWRGGCIAAIGDWAKARGCRELASDALLDNESSQRAHRALGFKETERVVYFTKKL